VPISSLKTASGGETQMTDYPHLLSTIKVGSINLPNRLVMGSMHLGLEEEPGGFERMAAFYAERARGGVGLIITGGISPNREGRPVANGACLLNDEEVTQHRLLADAVHAEGGRVIMQILHTGRYAKHADLVAPSAIRAPINSQTPRALTTHEVSRTIDDFARCARLAQKAGYDGVEIMGGEGYLINQFTAARTNHRQDEWGGDVTARMRFPAEIVRRTRAAVGPGFLISFRLSILDLVPGGSALSETIALAEELEAAGVDLLNTGVGWHEARVPTIATMVPRAAFAGVVSRVREHVSIPVVASNRINTPEIAEDILTNSSADMVAVARPLLADAAFLSKAATGRPHEINTCIGCNQACIDHAITARVTSCLVNPRAAHETLLPMPRTRKALRIGVVGAGPAGLAFSVAAAERGHEVTLMEAANGIGGQFDLARRIPGKAEFSETLRYFDRRLGSSGVDLHLGRRASAAELADLNFDHVVLATGVKPRQLDDLPGIDHPSVLGYLDVLRDAVPVGERVAVIGSGGIGFDVAEFLTHPHGRTDHSVSTFFSEWGVDPMFESEGGLAAPGRVVSTRQVTLLQRKSSKVGAGLGVTTGWIHRRALAARGVEMIAGVEYRRIDDAGLHITVAGEPRLLDVDNVVICAGQEPERELYDALVGRGLRPHLIGGSNVAAELDAKRAIREATELAARL
jgi:2,4-dienoyl-CoA reductase (NADPH2)